jgi:hypothetical protein
MKSRPIATRILFIFSSIPFLIAAAHFWSGPETPPAPPATDNRRAHNWLSPRRVIRVHVVYDADFDRDRDGKAREFIEQALDIVNIEWQRYRGEWFEISEMQLQPSGRELDASYVLGNFLLGTAFDPSTIRIRIVGRQLEVYSDGRTAMPIGGLAFRGSDVVLVSAPANVTLELLAFLFFHEIGHLWEASDIPFAGGDTTYGDKSHYTFDLDAGNAELLDSSRGPSPRDTPKLAPAILRRRFAAARRLTRDTAILGRLHDLLLHEPMPSNPAWEKKKRDLFDTVGDERIRRFVLDQERTPRERREESEVRRRLAAHYWRANEALTNGAAAIAEQELDAMRLLQENEANENVRILVGAVERKVRKQAR